MFNLGVQNRAKILPIFLQQVSQANQPMVLCVNISTGQKTAEFLLKTWAADNSKCKEDFLDLVYDTITTDKKSTC